MKAIKQTKQGWISLPIIALLLAVSAISVQYQKEVQASYKWRGQLSDIDEHQQTRRDFVNAFVISPSFGNATLSQCLGFCELKIKKANQTEKQWQVNGHTMMYQWTKYQSINAKVYYRLCTTENQQQYMCWWWQSTQLISSGWVSLSE